MKKLKILKNDNIIIISRLLLILCSMLCSTCSSQNQYNTTTNSSLNNYQKQTVLYRQANQIINEVPALHDKKNQNIQLLNAAEKYLAADLAQKAQTIIDNISFYELDGPEATRYHIILSKLNNSINQNISEEMPGNTSEDISEDISESHKVLSNNKIWTDLISQDEFTLDNYYQKLNFDHNLNPNAADKLQIINGWLELAKAAKNNQLLDNIQAWHNKYNNHPANIYINNYLNNINQNNNLNNSNYSNNPNKIAVMLPLSGAMSSIASAIKTGMVTEFYNYKNNNKPELVFIDTESKSDNTISYYQQALSHKPDIIIGPLEKSSVDLLNKYLLDKSSSYYFASSDEPDKHQPIIIALNYLTDNNTPVSQYLYQFGISTEDEAKQAAGKATKLGYKNALIITSNNQWGKRASEAYKNNFLTANNNYNNYIADELFIDKNSNLKSFISKNLNIDSSQKRKNTLQWIVGDKLDFQPRRRQDFDHIFIATSANEAKQIKPILKFYYANNIPLIATSSVHNYSYKDRTAHSLTDLNNTLFCDMPLLLQKNKKNNNQLKYINQIWGNNIDRLIRLYALGADSLILTQKLSALKLLPQIGISANTGHLYIDDNNKILRLLPWATINNGHHQINTALESLPIKEMTKEITSANKTMVS